MAHRPGSRSWRIDLPSHEALEGLSEQDRLEVIERLSAHLKLHPAFRVMTVVVLLLSLGAGIFLSKPIADWFQSFGIWRVPARVLGASVASLVTVIVGSVVGYWLLWSIWLRAFHGAMRDIGRDVCVECGYWLRGLDAEVARCPECGAKRAEDGAA